MTVPLLRGVFVVVSAALMHEFCAGQSRDGDAATKSANAAKEKKPKDDPGPPPIELKIGKSGSALFNGAITLMDVNPRFKNVLSKSFVCTFDKGKAYRLDLGGGKIGFTVGIDDPKGEFLTQEFVPADGLDDPFIVSAPRDGAYRINVFTNEPLRSFGLSIRLATDDEVAQLQLRERVRTLISGKPADAPPILQAVAKHLEAKKGRIDATDARIAHSADFFHRFEDRKERIAICTQYAKLLVGVEAPKVAQIRRIFESTARRLSLPGEEMELHGKSVDGKEFNLKDLKGKVVLVDFYAPSNSFWGKDIIHARGLFDRHKAKGFEVVSVVLNFHAAGVKEQIERGSFPWKTLQSREFKEGQTIADYYGAYADPLSILIGRDGRVLSINANGKELTRLLEKEFPDKK